jgi:thioredoxin reductase (NADPH)
VEDGYDIVVAGGGVAGLTAGLTAARLGRSTLVLAGTVPGGLLLTIDRIDGFPGFPEGIAGYELCPSLQEQADAAGAEVAALELEGLEQANGTWRIATAEGGVEARAVVVATGARFRRLDVPGEERLQGHGVSTCASCDGPLLGGKTVAVVGGGDSALQEALTLAEHTDRVVILHRGAQLGGQADYRRHVADHEAIEVRCGVMVEEIVGAELVEAVRLRDLANDAISELEVSAVFPFVGLQPNSEAVQSVVELDAVGGVRTDGALQASDAGVFAAGVVRSGSAGRAAAASGEGATAAIAADAYLSR